MFDFHKPAASLARSVPDEIDRNFTTGSGVGTIFYTFDDAGGGVYFFDGNYLEFNAESLQFIRMRTPFLVRCHDDIRLEFSSDRKPRRLRRALFAFRGDEHVVDISYRVEYGGAHVLVLDRPPVLFVASYLGIAFDGHDEDIAKRLDIAQVVDVPLMENIVRTPADRKSV